MVKLLKERKLLVFLAITFLEYVAANLAHPITPTLIKNLNLHDYMFGVAFAAMSFTNFLFSPFWGKMSSYVSPKKLLLIGCLGYSAGQILFCISKTELIIFFARCFSGFFVGAITVSQLVHVINISDERRSGINLTKFTTVQSVASAFGYMVGGLIGVYSTNLTFAIQAFALALSGILYYIFIGESNSKKAEKINFKGIIREANPLKSFANSKMFMTKSFAVIFIVVFFASFGTYAFDQCFNYYIKDQFGFSSAYNGLLKALVGIVTLIANSTICMWILKGSHIKYSTSMVLLCCAVSIFVMLMMENVVLFIIICIVFFAFNAIYIPLLQSCVAQKSTVKNGSMVMGFYNAIKSLGMIGGALIAGLIYGYGAKLPFIVAGIFFAAGAALLIYNTKFQDS